MLLLWNATMTGWTLDFFTRTIQKINKVDYKKILSETHAFTTRVCCMKCANFLPVYNKCMLCEHDCVKFYKRVAWHSFLENNFAELLYEVWVIISQDFVQSLVAFRYSNICCWKSVFPKLTQVYFNPLWDNHIFVFITIYGKCFDYILIGNSLGCILKWHLALTTD